MNADTNTIILFVSSAIVICLLVWIIYLEMRLRKILRGKNAATLEDTIAGLGSEVDLFHKQHKELEQYLSRVETRLKRSVQGLATVRFNPFPDKGGNHSFAVALLNEHGNGVVISTLCAREKVNIFAKPVESFISSHELTDEEKEAIAKARTGQ